MRKLRNQAGKPSGVPERKASAGFEVVNAPAERCSVHRGSLGDRFVRYRGRDYILIGLYYVPRPWRAPRPYFVLRRAEDSDRASVPAWKGARRRLRPAHLVRAGLCALIIAIVLTMPAWITSRPRSAVPSAAQRVAPSTMPRVPARNRGASISRSTPERGGAVDRQLASAVVRRSGRARVRRPPRRPLYTATRPGRTMIAFYAVSFGAFRDGRQAGEVARRVRAMGYRAIASPAGVSVRVHGHRYRTRANAARMVRIFRMIGLPASVEAVHAG